MIFVKNVTVRMEKKKGSIYRVRIYKKRIKRRLKGLEKKGKLGNGVFKRS